jgi:hypothetical protein
MESKSKTMADYEKHLNDQLSALTWDHVKERFRKSAVSEYRLVILYRDKRLGSWIRKNQRHQFNEGYKAWRNL